MGVWSGRTRLVLPLAVAAAVVGHCTLTVRSDSVGFGELEEQWRGEVQQVSWRPRAFLLKSFLSAAECDHIKGLARPKLEPSLVIDRETLQFKQSSVRSSSGAAFGRGLDKVLQRIEKRIATVTMIPVEHQEGLQVLHYVNGQEYKPHLDAFYDNYGQDKDSGGQRVLTMLMYLSTPEEGGETTFPNAEHKVSGPGWSDCALQGLSVKAVKGDALMFYSLTPDGKVDQSSLHASCPTLKGTKWTCTKWIHIHPFGVAPPPEDPSCRDTHPQCAEWAFFDECEVHTFDCTFNGQSIEPQRHTYHKVCVGQGGPLFKSWDEITRGLGHHHRGVDVAKIDIEGHEAFGQFLGTANYGLELCGAYATAAGFETGWAVLQQLALLFMHMGSLGYGVVGQEDNIWGEKGCCSEFTFLHVERQWLGFLGRAIQGYGRSSQHRGHSTFQQAKAAFASGDDNEGVGHQRHERRRRAHHHAGLPSLNQQP
eukprot:gene2713-3010_t